MKPIGKVIAAPFKALGLIPKTPKLPPPAVPLSMPTRDAAREAAQRAGRIAPSPGRRGRHHHRGGGAEAGPVSAKELLGS
jgi:hypothetical protein